MMAKRGIYVVFVAIGAVTAILELPLFDGLIDLPQALLAIMPSLIFAVPFTICALLFRSDDRSSSPPVRSYLISGCLLTIGMPIAITAGALSLNFADHIFPGGRIHLGGIGFSFFVAEIVSCFVWSTVLFAWTVIVNRSRGPRMFVTALLLIVVVMLISNFAAASVEILTQRDVLLPIISIGEQSISGLILAIGIVQRRGQSTRSIL
jgi:hypothetical protein